VTEKEKCEEQIDELGEELESRIKQLTVHIIFINLMKNYYYSMVKLKYFRNYYQRKMKKL